MYHGYKRPEDDDEGLGIGRRKPKVEREPELKPGRKVSRFPTREDGSEAIGFATLSHSNLKSWTKLAQAQGHNTRAIDAPNVRQGAPDPIELLDEQTGSYADRVKAVLEEHGAPVKIRKGGTIATEDVYGASPEYWNRNGDWKQKPVSEIINDPVVQAAVALARRKHGRRLISCLLHVDEESPHIHVVAVPLVQREHAKRGRKPKDCPIGPDGKPIDPRPTVLKWTLDVSSLRGQSRKLELNHDEWAETCKTFGLVRGEKGSEMTEEQKRARRNRQTGRSSIAEKVAREEREELLEEARAVRKRLIEEGNKEKAVIIAEGVAVARTHRDAIERQWRQASMFATEAKRKLEEAEERERAATTALEEAEALRSLQQARETELTRMLERAVTDSVAADEARSRAKLAENKAVELVARAAADIQVAQEAKSEAEEMKSAEVVRANELETLLEEARTLKAGLLEEGARTTELLIQSEADRETALIVLRTAEEERKALATDEACRDAQLRLVAKILNPKEGLSADIVDSKVRLTGDITDEERRILRRPWGPLEAAVVEVVHHAALFRQQAGVLERERSDIKVLRAELNEIRDWVIPVVRKAEAFDELWRDIPEEGRSPVVAATAVAASGLTLDDLPPGWTGRGGVEIE